MYKYYINGDIYEVYKHIILNNKNMPNIFQNKENYLYILKKLYKKKEINSSNITYKYMTNNLKLSNIKNYIHIEEVYKYLFGINYKLFLWKYQGIILFNISLDDIKVLFNNYMKYKNINIKNNIYSINYDNFIKECHLRNILIKDFNNDLLYFILNLFNYKYPAYNFKGRYKKYWKTKENRIKTLKYLIEEDIKLEKDKIPLYLTITSIRNISDTLYNVLKKYYSSLFEWVNEVYPDYFDPRDFDINYLRNTFDSEEEHVIDDILRENFSNVIYNKRNTKESITIEGMQPDWIILMSDKVILVEYFGMWQNRYQYNTRTVEYVKKAKNKILKYDELKLYNKLFIYPEDLKSNFKKLILKINDIKGIGNK
jgi:hypothetical protein